MGDFERTFGAGADIISIIDGINRANTREERQSFSSRSVTSQGRVKRLSRQRITSDGYIKKVFFTFESASDWSKKNNGKMFKPDPDGNGYIEG